MAENLRRNGGKSPCRWQTRTDLCNDVGVTLGYGGGFVTDKGSCRHNVCTVRHKDGCHLMAEGVGGSGGENSGFPFAACPPCGSDTV